MRRGFSGRSSARLALAVLGAVGMVAMVLSWSSVAMADGGLESEKGGLFHRKGWISPEIYRKRRTNLLNNGVQSSPGSSDARAKQKSVRVASVSAKPRVLKTAARQRSKPQSKKRGSKRNERVKTKKRSRVTAKRRIPKRLVKRRERKLSNAAKERRVKVASLGLDALPAKKRPPTKAKSVTGGSPRVSWRANSRCVPGRLKAAINYVARNFGRVRVNSTCRSRRHNRRVGGASRSWHLKSRAADIRVFGNIRKAARYLRSVVGGYKHYGRGLFHIDTGPRRSW